ncbi:ERMES complex subunit [Mortierella claussenii]|nr:ERMES complex subunit [Mortierella claussenii]
MAFRFQWPYFSDEFIQEAKTMLTNALNKGNKPAVIVDHITVKELDMGTLPPELEMLEMGELSMERFRGIFKLTYNGDAHIVLQTKVQANPMNVKKTDNPSYTRRGILAADQPLVVPMLLRISDFKLRGIIVLVVDQIKGITLVFKNDPLESVLVSSTFDSITPIQRFLQSEIEKQLRNLFQEDLPSAIHNLSQQFTKKPEEVQRQHSQDDVHARPGLYDGGLGTPMVSLNPSRRSSMQPGTKKVPGKPSSEPDLSMGVHYDEDGLRPVRKPASATVRSESPDSESRHNPHTDYTGEVHGDLLETSLKHPSNNPVQNKSSRAASRRSSHLSDRYEQPGMSISSTTERLSMRDNHVLSSLGIAESTHLANQFANLIHSNQTISPYAQNLEHFTFRSVPPKRPASVQYFGHNGSYRADSPGYKSGPNSLNSIDISKDSLGNARNNMAGQPNGYTQYRNETGYGQSSPRISHRRLQSRVGIRRYAMQLGAGGGPRELSDHDSDEYNDVDEAVSESEYVYVEKVTRQSLDNERDTKQRNEQLNTTSSIKHKVSPASSSTLLQTIDGQEPMFDSRPRLHHRHSSDRRDQYDSLLHASATMPGGFSSSVDPQTWRTLDRQTVAEGDAKIETRSMPLNRTLSPEEVLHREMAAMQLNSRQSSPALSSSPSSSSSASSFPPFGAPPSPSQINDYAYKPSPVISTATTTSTTTTTARAFSNTQRHSQPSPRLSPPGALKRDKRNSSILSSRRVSSVGIGLGVLSKDGGDKNGSSGKTLPSQPKPELHARPSLYRTRPFSAVNSKGWPTEFDGA